MGTWDSNGSLGGTSWSAKNKGLALEFTRAKRLFWILGLSPCPHWGEAAETAWPSGVQ